MNKLWLALGVAVIIFILAFTEFNLTKNTADDILGDLLLEKKQSLLSMHFDLLNDCTKEETEILIALLQSSKQTLKKYRITK